MGVPDMPTLENKNVSELRNLTVTQIKWSKPDALSLTLSDDQSCEARRRFGGFTDSHTFDPAKKITKIEVIIHKYDSDILSIDFYHYHQALVSVKYSDDWYIEDYRGRVEVFNIADDEQLIGCKLDKISSNNSFKGVTWIKIQVKF